jgi:DNA-binding response OmpR family regulator
VPDTSGVGATVLVVDDEPHIGRIIRTRLEQDGLQVLLAETGPDALAIVADTPRLSLVVLDLMLPGMSGVDVLRILRADPRWSDLPCIVLTAAGQDDQLQAVEALGVAQIMTKPFSPRRLLARVRDHVDGATPPQAPSAPPLLPDRLAP